MQTQKNPLEMNPADGTFLPGHKLHVNAFEVVVEKFLAEGFIKILIN